jgi:hypothetical protein
VPFSRAGVRPTPVVHLVAGDGPDGVVAVMQAEDERSDRAVCWWNSRVLRAEEVPYVRLWAARAVACGWRFCTIREADLLRFRGGATA